MDALDALDITAAQVSKSQGSPLLRKLPPEIRNLIYRAVLVADSDILITETKSATQERTALLKASSQILVDSVNETLGVEWLEVIGKEHARSLTKLKVAFQNYAVSTEMKSAVDNARYDRITAVAAVRGICKTGVPGAISCAKSLLRLDVPTSSVVQCENKKQPPPKPSSTYGENIQYVSLYYMATYFLSTIDPANEDLQVNRAHFSRFIDD